jgi:hypothetical protein
MSLRWSPVYLLGGMYLLGTSRCSPNVHEPLQCTSGAYTNISFAALDTANSAQTGGARDPKIHWLRQTECGGGSDDDCMLTKNAAAAKARKTISPPLPLLSC